MDSINAVIVSTELVILQKKKHDALLALILKTLSLQNYGSYGWV